MSHNRLSQGESDGGFSKRLDRGNHELREKGLAFTETLYPGSWSSVTLVVSPVSTELKDLSIVSVETGQVSLAMR